MRSLIQNRVSARHGKITKQPRCLPVRFGWITGMAFCTVMSYFVKPILITKFSQEPKSHSECPLQCAIHGTCNEELGMCMCLGGYSGFTCSEVAMPTCSLKENELGNRLAPCAFPFSCECMAECNSFLFEGPKFCFDRTKKLNKKISVSIISQGKLLHLSEEDQRFTVNNTAAAIVSLLHPDFCEDRCSGHGVCYSDNENRTFCLCPWGFGGLHCETQGEIPFQCLNECSDRGVCVEGTCHCKDGYFGVDCSLFVSKREGEKQIRRVKQRNHPWLPPPFKPEAGSVSPKIYIYELPPELNTWQFQQSSQRDASLKQDLMEVLLFYERLLSSPYRTLNADVAHYFFIPLFIGNRSPGNQPIREELLNRVVHYMRKNFRGILERTKGKNHLFFGGGFCHENPVFNSAITMASWPIENCHMDSDSSQLLVPLHLTPSFLDQSPFLPQQQAQSQANSTMDGSDRTILLYVPRIGQSGPFDPHRIQAIADAIQSFKSDPYGRSRVEFLPEKVPGSDEAAAMKRSKFCLVFGDPTPAVIMGCIPVLVQPWAFLPFDGETVAWESMSLQLNLPDLPGLPAALERVPAADYRAGQVALRHWWTRFVWASPSWNPAANHRDTNVLKAGDAFEGVMAALAHRLAVSRSQGKSRGVRASVSGQGKPANSSESKSRMVNPVRPSKCHVACSERGTCNEEIGRCECLTGLAGSDCSQPAMPACHVATSHGSVPIPCNVRSSCACAQDCVRFAFGWSSTYAPERAPLCHLAPDPSTDRNSTDGLWPLFPGQLARVHFDASWRATGATPVLTSNSSSNEPGQDPWVDPAYCPNYCSLRGACEAIDGGFDCWCSWLHRGPDCSERAVDSPFLCFNGCSGRGSCQDGVCHCTPGTFGLDCSLSMGPDGRPTVLKRPELPWLQLQEGAAGSGSGPLIYVYEIPQYLNTWQHTHSIVLDWFEPMVFIERLLVSPNRTPLPEKADFFFIPLILRNRVGMKGPAIQAAFDFINSTFHQFWTRFNASDHIVLASDDWGACEVDEYGVGSPLLDNLIVLSLWGHTRNSKLGPERPCFVPNKDIVIPPIMPKSVYPQIPFLQTEGLSAEPDSSNNRTILAYFRGFSGDDSDYFGNFTWSFGVRQALFEHFSGAEEESGIVLEETSKFANVSGFAESMRNAVFCLAPAGWGWGMRSTQSVLLGCIPVVIQPSVLQAFEGDFVDWFNVGVVLGPEAIPKLDNVLKTIPSEVIEHKRRMGSKVWTRFMWNSPSFNPLSSFPNDVQQKWGTLMLKEDCFATVVEILGNRLKKKKKKKAETA